MYFVLAPTASLGRADTYRGCHVDGPTVHWFDDPLVRKPIGPMTHWYEKVSLSQKTWSEKMCHWSDGRRLTGPKKCDWSENPLVRQISDFDSKADIDLFLD